MALIVMPKSIQNFGQAVQTAGAKIGGALTNSGIKQIAPKGNIPLPPAAVATKSPANNIAPYANVGAYQNAMEQKNQLADIVNWGNQQLANGINPGTGETIAEEPTDNGGGGSNGGSGGGTSAYEQAMIDAYNQRTALLGDNFNNAMAQLLNGYNFNADAVNKAADNALREAYINRMMNEKNLNQRLSMQGLNGGASESTIAGLLNNYGQSRNKIETERMGDLADLLNTYQNNVAKAQQSYNEALINAMPSYSNLISAQKAANAGTKSTSTSSNASANTSTAASVAQRVAGGEALSSVMDDLLARTGGDYSAAMKILREAGLA